MKITQNYYIKGHNTVQNIKQVTNEQKATKTAENHSELPYCPIAFKAAQNIKPKKVDPEVAKGKLLKQINEILAENMDIDELYAIYERQCKNEEKQIRARVKKINNEIDNISKATTLPNKTIYNRLIALRDELVQLRKKVRGKHPAFVPPKNKDERIDVALVNKFKSALLEDNFNFDKVYKKHYQKLETIDDVNELSQMYPNIKVPTIPHVVLVERIEACLTRDFYEEFDNIARTKSPEAARDFCYATIKDLFFQSPKADESIFNDIVDIAALKIALNHRNLVKEKKSFSSLPEHRKNKIPQITDLDKKLMSINYNDFILYVLREQYLNNKKPNQITYTENGIKINVSELQSTPYRFEKTPEKIKLLLSSAFNIKAARRDYEHFDEEKFRNRLSYFETKEHGKNEKILEKIIDFESCDLNTKDKEALIKLLRIFDQVLDGNITLQDAIKEIEEKDLTPKETKKKQRLEKQKIADAIKLEQQKALELDKLKEDFDDAINILYLNNLSGIATTAAELRPAKLDKDSKAKAEFIINTIRQHYDVQGSLQDKEKLKQNISSFVTYNYYSTNEPENELFAEAIKYATDSDGSLYVLKAGQYLNNAEIIENAPESLNYVKDREIIENIIDKFSTNTEQIEAICKFDEYRNLDEQSKTQIGNILNIFDLKSNTEKYLLKQIVENKYANVDTTHLLSINESANTEATLSSSAKQQIIDKYKFPLCLNYLEKFEESMRYFAGDSGSSGVKKVVGNKGYKWEIKIMGHDDRVFSTRDDFYFDEFLDKGLH